jgi:formylmethanofuran dehydrogenase subunit C
MGRLILKLKGAPATRLDLSGLMPALQAGKSRPQIERLDLGGGVTLADAFAVSGETGGDITIEGGSARLDGVGAGLDSGTFTIEGDLGAGAARGMRGGHIEIRGSAGADLASGMKGGIVHVTGSAGDRVGAVAAGHRFGMTGGHVIVDGNIGARAGDKMRRGLILVRGTTGEAAGSRMIGGTIIAEGGLGAGPGVLMRRGTLIAPKIASVLSTFGDCGVQDLVILRVIQRAYARDLGPLAPRALPHVVRRLAGDLATIGKGEILLTAM